MKIDSVDLFYLSMPTVTDEGDGSQDALLVRVVAGGIEGWGECEASPLTSIAAYITPMSHGACQPVRNCVLGQRLDDIHDIERISQLVARNCMDLLQAQHTWSGIEIALWDVLGKSLHVPVWSLLGFDKAFPKTPYASVLFGETSQETLARAQKVRQQGFRAAKFGWGPFGAGALQDDADQLHAAREGLGRDATLLVDAGQIWGTNVDAAVERIVLLKSVRASWLEEPFYAGALVEYADLKQRCDGIQIAGGEAAHTEQMARHIIDFGRIDIIQIDCGRIGGIGPSKKIYDHAEAAGISYVNHTFTSHLALSASLQPFAGSVRNQICEFPAMPKQLAIDITENHFLPDANGQIQLSDKPGLGVDVDIQALKKYRVEVNITVGGKQIF